ncbi:MAG: hypothetical protein MZV63_33825 [Marinilabiliales bacterium]|nr:hypothetical protein [Marinilabiliales bacterium]
MVSRPSFDPNLFAQRISGEDWQRIATDSAHPLAESRLPGPVPARIHLQADRGHRRSGERRAHAGDEVLGSRVFPSGQRQVRRLEEGRPRQPGPPRRHRQLLQRLFLSGGPARRDRRDRARVPRPSGWANPRAWAWATRPRAVCPIRSRRAAGKPPWTAGNTVVSSIGQGLVVTSPMQLLAMVSAIANGGTIYRPLGRQEDCLTVGRRAGRVRAGGDPPGGRQPGDPGLRPAGHAGRGQRRHGGPVQGAGRADRREDRHGPGGEEGRREAQRGR